jgi:hypothetical protein
MVDSLLFVILPKSKPLCGRPCEENTRIRHHIKPGSQLAALT